MERFTGLGVRVITAAARFTDKETVTAGEHVIKARYFVVATGSAPVVPPIPGLADVPYFTNETIFDNVVKLPHLIVIGGGPIGLELAQAHARLGSAVTVVEGAKALGKDDPEMSDVVLKALRAEGIDIREGTLVERVSRASGNIVVHVKSNDSGEGTIEGTHILVAAGRRANTADLGLDVAGVGMNKQGIVVDAGARTSNPRIFAIGDVTSGLQFTHVANDHAGLVVKRALFKVPAKTIASRAVGHVYRSNWPTSV